MPTALPWSEIAIRLLSTIAAGVVIGLNRGEHGRPAGLRTTLLVSVAACLSMIQVNLLLPMSGRNSSSFVMLDLMRLPLGVLSGMGFIGAGAIVRRDNFVAGVTTAATMWFVTVTGLCFGGGQIALGFLGSLIAIIILEVLKHVESHMKQDHMATLSMVVDPTGPSQEEIREKLNSSGLKLSSYAFTYTTEQETTELQCDLLWRAARYESKVPDSIQMLSRRPGVLKIAWTPQPR